MGGCAGKCIYEEFICPRLSIPLFIYLCFIDLNISFLKIFKEYYLLFHFSVCSIINLCSLNMDLCQGFGLPLIGIRSYPGGRFWILIFKMLSIKSFDHQFVYFNRRMSRNSRISDKNISANDRSLDSRHRTNLFQENGLPAGWSVRSVRQSQNDCSRSNRLHSFYRSVSTRFPWTISIRSECASESKIKNCFCVNTHYQNA